MKPTNEKKKIVYIVGLIAIAVVSALLMITVLLGDFSIRDFLESSIRTEMIYLLLVIAILLPLMMLLLAIALQVENKRGTKPQRLDAGDVIISSPSGKTVLKNSAEPSDEAANAEETAQDGLDDEKIAALLAERSEAKKAKNYARADAIRAELLEKGVTLTDTSAGTKWSKD